MGEMNEDDPSEINSFPVDKALHANFMDLNKKRKFLDGLPGLPPPKHKFRERGSGSVQHPHAEEVLEWHGVKEIGIKEWPPENSEMDSNNFVEESESSTSQSIKAKSQSEIPNSFAHDQAPTFEPGFRKLYSAGLPSSSSTFSGTCSNSNFKTSEIRTIEEEEERIDKEETSPFFEDQKPHGEYANFSGHEGDEIEEFLDDDSEDIMLYSNATTSSDLFGLSSGRWNTDTNADARLGVTKPTIDQEFEQYFSMLML